MEKKCRSYFSLKIGENMRKMGKEKTRPQVIAISAKDTVLEHPECKKFLSRPKEKVELRPGIILHLSSKSFRLYRNKPCYIRVFFQKKASDDGKWVPALRKTILERMGVRLPRDLKVNETQHNQDYWEVYLDSPSLIVEIIKKRIANFLD